MNEISRWPKISVIIITYNQAHLIGETLDSVLNQNYENLEIVVADDCSTDDNQKIILEYQRRYPSVIVPVFNQVNLGITGNSNAAFFAATGELIAVLGGDDLFLPGKLKGQAEQFIADSDVVLSYHPVDVFFSATNETLFVSNQSKREDINNAYDIISQGGIAGASSVMVRRSACPSGGFDTRLPTVSDWMFYIEVALKGKVVKLDGVYGRYRKHGLGASERTYELLEESLRTLTLVQEMLPNDLRLRDACEKGAARYLAGEVYRQLAKNPIIAKELADRMITHRKDAVYLGLWGVAKLFRRVPLIARIFQRTLGCSKFALKRFFG